MAEIAVPDQEYLIQGDLTLGTPSQVNRSGWTGKRKVIGLPGIELWAGAFSIADIATEEMERQWRAFIFGLRGPLNWFKWILPCNTHAGSKPTVRSGAGNGYTLPLAGLSTSTTILKAGQFITVPLPSGYDRAVCLNADLVSNSSGQATAQFEPALGETPTAGVTVETKDPFVRMALTATRNGLQTVDGVSGGNFDVEEAR